MSRGKKIAMFAMAACVCLLFFRTGGCSLPVVASPATAATYFHDVQEGEIPVPVKNAIDSLNAAGIVATNHEVDTTDGSGDVPDQHKVSLPAAKAAGLPSLVVMAGERVLTVLKDPQTEQEIMEAAGK